VAGHREMENGEIAVRTQKGDDLGVMSIEEFIDRVSGDLSALR
jgi:threonyl-tRNA synthetase